MTAPAAEIAHVLAVAAMASSFATCSGGGASGIDRDAMGGGGDGAVIDATGCRAADLPGTAAEIAATPRADPNLELLALSQSPGLTANQEVYDRIVADVAAIRSAEPGVAGIGVFPADDARSLLVTFTTDTGAQIRRGAYHAWDCLNDHLGVASMTVEDSALLGASLATVTLKGLYDLRLLTPLYAALPGATRADPNTGGGDGPTICLTRTTAAWHYVFDDAAGDCPAGCTEHHQYYFVSDAPGTVRAVGEWASTSPEPRPTWSDQYGSRAACHPAKPAS